MFGGDTWKFNIKKYEITCWWPASFGSPVLQKFVTKFKIASATPISWREKFCEKFGIPSTSGKPNIYGRSSPRTLPRRWKWLAIIHVRKIEFSIAPESELYKEILCQTNCKNMFFFESLVINTHFIFMSMNPLFFGNTICLLVLTTKKIHKFNGWYS